MKSYGEISKPIKTEYPDEWLSYYKKLRGQESRLIEVVDIEDNRLIMPNIGSSGVDYMVFMDLLTLGNKVGDGKRIIHEAVSQYFEIISNIFLFQKDMPDNKMFIHADLHARNFVIMKNGDMILIDPDSFILVDTPYPSYYFLSQMMHGFFEVTLLLQRIYDEKNFFNKPDFEWGITC